MIPWPVLTFASLVVLAFPISSSAVDAREIRGEGIGVKQQPDASLQAGQEKTPESPAEPEPHAQTEPDRKADPETAPDQPADPEPEAKAQTQAQPETPAPRGDTSGVNDPFMKKWHRFKTAWRDITTYDFWDGMFRMRMGFRAQADATLERTDTAVEELVDDAGDGTDFRRVRLFASGLFFRHLKFKFSFDFAVDSGLKDAYIETAGKFSQYAFFRVGFFKEPVSLQRLTSGMDIGFLEWGLPVSTFAPGRSLGAMFHHPRLNGRMTWAAGFFTIGSNAKDNTGRSDLTLDARVTGLPVDRKNGSRLLHLGASASVRRPNNDQIQYRTRPEARFMPFFVDTGEMPTDGDTRLFGAEIAAVRGPFWAQAEILVAHVGSNDLSNPRFTGSYLEAGWFLTGEIRPYNHQLGILDHVEPVKNVKGRNPFNKSRLGGALEITGRFSTVDLNDSLVTGGELRNLSAGMNWYLNASNRVSLNYIHAKLLDVGKSNILLFRYQYTPRP